MMLYDHLLDRYTKEYGLDFNIIKNQMLAESSGNPYAISPAKAMGLMQFTPETWRDFGEGNPFDPECSIKSGCKYMRFLLDRFTEIPCLVERYKFALAAYNAGRGNINQALSLARESCGHPASFSEWDKMGRPEGAWQTWTYTSKFLRRVTGSRSEETINYVRKIMG